VAADLREVGPGNVLVDEPHDRRAVRKHIQTDDRSFVHIARSQRNEFGIVGRAQYLQMLKNDRR
jgi:hypothetical protein